MEANRLGTGRSSPSSWVGPCDDEKPAAPASMASATTRAHLLDLVRRWPRARTPPRP